MISDAQNQPPEPIKPTRSWVWCCTDESIAAGQVSVLAVLEMVVAVGVYWLLALQFEWPWMAFVTMIAAPILLMRSNESIALGVKLMSTFWKPTDREISRRDKIIIFLVAAQVTGIASYWLATHWLADYVGWSLFWRAAMLGATTTSIAVAGAGVHMARGPGMTVSMGASMVVGAFLGAGAGASVIVGAFLAAVLSSIAVEVKDKSRNKQLVFLVGFISVILLAPFYALGGLIRGLIIRLYATMRHPLAGLAQLPQNWRETLLVIDFTHPPELLPQSGTISCSLSVKGIWINRHFKKGAYKLCTPIFIAAWYLSALIYRWSLKASAWLWFPLSLVFTPPLHQRKAQDSRRWMAILHAWHWPFLLITTIGILWLLAATPWIETWLPLLPTEYTTIHANLPSPPAFGFRYALACLGCLLFILIIVKSRNLNASHGSILKSPNEFKALALADKAEFLSIAKGIDKIRLLLIAVLILWGEMMALGFYHAHYPDVLESFISPVLLSYL